MDRWLGVRGSGRIALFLLVVVVPPVVANLIAIWAQFPLTELLFPESLSSMTASGTALATGAAFWLSVLLPFPVAFTALGLWLSPLLRAAFSIDDLKDLSPEAQRRLASYPWATSFASLGGWLVAGVMLMITSNAVSQEGAVLRWAILWLELLVFGSLSLVFTYYLALFLSRRFLFPLAFPDGLPGSLLARRTVGLGGQMAIFLWSVSGFSLLIGLIGVLRWSGVLEGRRGAPWELTLGVFASLATFAFVLSWLFFRALARPLRSLDEAAEKLGRGQWDIQLRNWNTDEIGRLGHTLNLAATGLAEREDFKERLGQFVDPKVRDYLLRRGLTLGGERTQATILFADLRSFTGWSEAQTPEQVVVFLNRFYTVAGAIVQKHGGIINKFLGDAILAVFGPPEGLEDHRRAGLEASLELLEVWRTEPLGLCMGLHAGEVVAGTVGSESRLEYTVLGDTVNTASRLEAHTRHARFHLLASRSVFETFEPTAGWTALGPVRLRGKEQELELFGYAPW